MGVDNFFLMNSNEILLPIATIFIALLGVVFTFQQFRLAKKKRKDDLFKLRYAFYRKLSNNWVKTHNRNNPTWDRVDLFPISEEANFLFGEDISAHILSLEHKRASHGLFPDDNFSGPFQKYLKLN